MSVRLFVEPPGAPAFERDLDEAELVIGRSTTAGLILTDSSASRQHARLFQRDGAWWLEDLGTRNGTLLNDQPLGAPTCLQPGDRIKVGGTTVRFGTNGAETPYARPPGDGAPGQPDWSSSSISQIDAPGGDRQAARFRTLNDIHRALATPISLSALLDLILERCFEVLRPEEGVILLEGKDGEMRPAATRHVSGTTDKIFISRRIVDEVAGKGMPVLVMDAAMDERFASSESIIMSGIKSVVAAPLIDAEGTIGLIALCSRAKVKRFAEPDLEMLTSLASAAALRVRNVALAEEAAARRVLERELSLAHDMQMSMLPRRLPERPEVELAASLKSARSVGGDLYDFVLDGDRLWFIVADVSGKGVAAALYMAVAKTLFRATAQGEVSVAEVLARMNRELVRDNDQMMFVTAVVGHLRLSTGDAVLGDAGHNPVLLGRRDGRLTTVGLAKGVALGVVEDHEFAQQSLALEPGDALVLYTDGATDARNPAGDLLGTARLEQTIAAVVGESVESIVAAIARAVDGFAADAPQEDDVTVLVLRYRGA